MASPDRRKRWPGLSPATSRHIERKLASIDWEALTQPARDSCKDCPGLGNDECNYCPLHGYIYTAAYLSTLSRSARHTDKYLQNLPITDDNDK